jgi:hypothetical protein
MRMCSSAPPRLREHGSRSRSHERLLLGVSCLSPFVLQSGVGRQPWARVHAIFDICSDSDSRRSRSDSQTAATGCPWEIVRRSLLWPGNGSCGVSCSARCGTVCQYTRRQSGGRGVPDACPTACSERARDGQIARVLDGRSCYGLGSACLCFRLVLAWLWSVQQEDRGRLDLSHARPASPFEDVVGEPASHV